mgnify:FL=1
MKNRLLQIAAVIALAAGCGDGKPGVDGLRESFAQQLAANRAVKDFQRSGEDLLFSGPGPEEGPTVKWRVHIDSTVIEPSGDPDYPYKGIVKSSWYANDQPIRPSASGKDSNLPIALTSNGLAQECWGLWDKAARKWGWD